MAEKEISYRQGNNLDLAAVIELYRASTLGERRPVEEPERMAAMLQHANLVITAWHGNLLVGISRALTDFVYTTYLSDLAVHADYQHQGIGKELIRRTKAATDPRASLTLLAAPAGEKYYPHIGFQHMPQCWRIPSGENI